jgi:hypothetical protein
MKAREHIFIGVILLFVFLYLDNHYGNFISNLLRLNFNLDIVTIILGIGLYLVGTILPDSDKIGSRIFHTNFAIIGYFCYLLEMPIALILNRKKGHRQALHTIFGILITSTVIAIFISALLDLMKLFVVATPPYLFICLFLGQLVHLVCDINLTERYFGLRLK